MLMLQLGVHYLVLLILFSKPLYIIFKIPTTATLVQTTTILCLNNYRTSVEPDFLLIGLPISILAFQLISQVVASELREQHWQ